MKRTLAVGAALGLGTMVPGVSAPAPETKAPEPGPEDERKPPTDITAHDPKDVVAVVSDDGSVELEVEPPPPPPLPPPPPPPADPPVSMFTNVAKSWSEPAPGIRHLSITADQQKVEIVEIDLRSGLYDVRATRPEERGRTVSRFAADTGAVIAVNGDLFEYGSYQPIGLAVGDGVHWQGTSDNADWLFFACDGQNSCIIDRQATGTPLDPSWTDVVGAQGAALVVDGAPQIRGDFPHGVERHPRTAIGMTEDGKLLLLVAAGRSGDAAGMTYDEMATLMGEMGAKDAINLDGGGSSALVVHGQRVSQLPDHGNQERVVSNHIGIVPKAR